eukprot:sb/3475718/
MLGELLFNQYVQNRIEKIVLKYICTETGQCNPAFNELAHPLGTPQVRAFFAPSNINNTVAMATELVTMGTGMLKVIRKYQQTPTGSVSNSFTAFAPIGCAPSKGFFITRPASPGGSFRPFQRQ